MNPMTIAAYAFWLAATAFLMHFELNTDDTGVVVFFILAITFILGCLHPKHAWQWALLVGPAVPGVHLIYGAHGSDINSPKSFAILLAVVLVLGFAGAYAGVLARKVLSGGAISANS